MGQTGSDLELLHRAVETVFHKGYIPDMAWGVEYTDEFGDWWMTLGMSIQEAIDAHVRLLETYGPQLPYPYSSGIERSRHSHLRELRIQHKGHPWRVLYAFDPRRTSILLLGGDKTGDEDWYEVHVRIADRLYDDHIAQLEREGLI